MKHRQTRASRSDRCFIDCGLRRATGPFLQVSGIALLSGIGGVSSALSRARNRTRQGGSPFQEREGACYTAGMGTALYKALREAGVSDEIATAAADDAGQTERLQRMEERLTRVEVTLRVLVGLAVAILVVQLQPFFA